MLLFIVQIVYAQFYALIFYISLVLAYIWYCLFEIPRTRNSAVQVKSKYERIYKRIISNTKYNQPQQHTTSLTGSGDYTDLL